MPRITLAAAAVVVALAWPAAAPAATSNLAYSGDTVMVTGNPSAFSVTVAHLTQFVFPGGLQNSYRISSSEGFANASAKCADTSGSAPPTSFDCDPVPAMTAITGSAQADTITASCSFLFSSPRMTVNAGAGADTITAACGADALAGGPGDDSIDAGRGGDAVEGGDGDDSLAGGSGVDSLQGGTGDDSLQAGGDDDIAAGGAGADGVAGGDGTDHLLGEDGKDTLAGGVGDDLLEGGTDRDTLDGGDGNDTLDGGDGRDLLLPGAGTDVVRGGTSVDTVSYEDRAGGAPLRISLNATGDDGAESENDAIAADVENVIGSPGPDTIVGNDGPNDLDAGDSNDTIEPAGGSDFVDAGAGDDRVTARDGAQDRIDCGSGQDVAVTDEFDVVEGCEVVQASRELMADVDNDGIPAPADCDDRNAAVRPGIPDMPGNHMDDDCLGGDAPFPRIETPIQFSFKFHRRYTRITRLVVLDLPAAARIELRCKGGRRRGCFKGVKRVRVKRPTAQKSVTRFVRKRRLKRRARLEIRVVRTGSVGKVLRLGIRVRKAPKLTRRCLPPGARTPRRC